MSPIHRSAVVLVLTVGLSACGEGSKGKSDEASGGSGGTPLTPPPDPEAISAAEGGTVTSPDGLLSLAIPGGALVEDTRITIAAGTEADLPEFFRPAPGPVYRLEPDGLQFQQPVAVVLERPGTLPTPDAEVRSAMVVTSSAAMPTELAGPALGEESQVIVLDPADGSTRLEASITHFSVLTEVYGALTYRMTAHVERPLGPFSSSFTITATDAYDATYGGSGHLGKVTAEADPPISSRSPILLDVQFGSGESTLGSADYACDAEGNGTYGISSYFEVVFGPDVSLNEDGRMAKVGGDSFSSYPTFGLLAGAGRTYSTGDRILVWSTCVDPANVTSACCQPTGECGEVPASQCDGTVVDDCTQCLTPPVNCCQPSGVCTSVDPAQCSGTVVSDCAECQPPPPPVNCCQPSGVCTSVPAGQCTFTAVTDCALCEPAPLTGACCDAASACTDSDQAACTGEFYALISCGSITCPGSCDGGATPTPLAAAAEVATALVPSNPPFLQNVLGGRRCGLLETLLHSNGLSSSPPPGNYVEIDARFAGVTAIQSAEATGLSSFGPGGAAHPDLPGSLVFGAGSAPPPFPSGNAVVVIAATKGLIPIAEVARFFQYGFVFDSDGIPGNNYVAPLAYPNDFFQGTDQWYEVLYDPTNGWSLKVTDAAGGTFIALASAARVVVYRNALVLFIPVTEFESANPAWRETAFWHLGDFALTGPPFNWQGDVDPSIASGLEPFVP